MAERPPKRRPKGSPYAMLVGDLALSPEQLRVFDGSSAGAFGKPFWIPTDDGRKGSSWPSTEGPRRRVTRSAYGRRRLLEVSTWLVVLPSAFLP
jgi:hypothetical protein